MKRKIKITEQDLYRIVKRVIIETEEKETNGKFFTLGGFYFFIKDGDMYLADDTKGEFSENLMVSFPNTKEISAVWGQNTKEIDDPETKGKDLKNLIFDEKMTNALNFGNKIFSTMNKYKTIGGGLKPIVYYSLVDQAPVLAGMYIGTDYSEPSEGKLIRTIENPNVGDKIFYQKSTFKPLKGKEYGISLQFVTDGNEIDLKKLGINSKNSLKFPKTYNVGDFFDENSSSPKNLEKAEFLEGIRKHIKNGGKINKITIDASTSKIPAGHENNNPSGRKWKELNEYDTYVMGNNDDGTGNLQLCKHKAINTYRALKSAIPELASAPYVLKASGPVGEYVHIKFE